MKDVKILLFDIETSPSLGYFFEYYREGNIVRTKESWYVLSVAYKWLGEKKVHVVALPDFKGYKKNKEDDYLLMQHLHKLFEEADYLVAHNGDNFDIKKVNARFVTHRLTPPKPYKSIDTLKIARRHFKFDSNRLNDLATHLGIGKKVSTMGFDTWHGCMTGDTKAWALMKKYNKHDVVLLEKVYLVLRPWSTTHPNVGVITRNNACPVCSSTYRVKRGHVYTLSTEAQRYNCLNCGKWYSDKPEKIGKVWTR